MQSCPSFSYKVFVFILDMSLNANQNKIKQKQQKRKKKNKSPSSQLLPPNLSHLYHDLEPSFVFGTIFCKETK